MLLRARSDASASYTLPRGKRTENHPSEVPSPTMQVATGTVVDGRIVVEGVSLAEGSRVTVVTRGADEGFLLTDAQETALLESLAEIERGQYVSVEELIASLPTPR